MRWPSTQTINEKSNNPNGINNALFDLLSKLNTTYQELSNVPRVVDSDTYGRYREYPDGTTQGRYVINGTLRSAGIALTTNVVVNVGQLTLPIGKWKLGLGIGFTPAATTTITRLIGAISRTSATRPGTDTIFFPTNGEVEYQVSLAAIVPGANLENGIEGTGGIVDLPEETTFYAVARGTFGVSTLSGYGNLWAESVV